MRAAALACVVETKSASAEQVLGGTMEVGGKVLRGLAIAVCSAAMVMAPTGVPASEAVTCPSVTWGSLPKVDRDFTANDITSVRSGRQACFDRLVIDLDRDAIGYDVHYGTVYAEGSGAVVPVRGTDLSITVYAWGRSLRPSTEMLNFAGYSTFRQLSWGGTFEGHTTLGLGVRARLPMRVFWLDGPGSDSRLVIDVAHSW